MNQNRQRHRPYICTYTDTYAYSFVICSKSETCSSRFSPDTASPAQVDASGALPLEAVEKRKEAHRAQGWTPVGPMWVPFKGLCWSYDGSGGPELQAGRQSSQDDRAVALAGRAALGSPTSNGFFLCKPFGAYASKGCRGASDRSNVGQRPTPAG